MQIEWIIYGSSIINFWVVFDNRVDSFSYHWNAFITWLHCFLSTFLGYYFFFFGPMTSLISYVFMFSMVSSEALIPSQKYISRPKYKLCPIFCYLYVTINCSMVSCTLERKSWKLYLWEDTWLAQGNITTCFHSSQHISNSLTPLLWSIQWHLKFNLCKTELIISMP